MAVSRQKNFIPRMSAAIPGGISFGDIMNRKRWSMIAMGTVLATATFLFGWTWYSASSNGESMHEAWGDLREVRSVNDFVSVVSGQCGNGREGEAPAEPEAPETMALHADFRGSRLGRSLALPLPPQARRRAANVKQLIKFVALQQKDAPQGTTAPMFGGTPFRNMVNTVDKNIPVTWSVEEGKQKNIKWSAELGDQTYSGPVIADGKVFVGINNKIPRDPKVKGDKAILVAFNEADGKFLWQLAHDMAPNGAFTDFGMVTTPTIEGKRLYYTTPACIVVCADTDGKIQWTYDMAKEMQVSPFHCAGSSPLIVGDLIMIVTGNGINEDGKIASPKAPSFVAFNKNTGKPVWQSNLPGDRIIEGQWSNPTLAVVNGKQQVIFPGGDCVLYSFEPESGKLIWKCDCLPARKKKGDDNKVDNYITATPVVVGDKLYIGLGPMPDHAKKAGVSYFLCLDITKQGDVSLKSYDAKDAANKDSALIWSFGGPRRPDKSEYPRIATATRDVNTGVICGTAAVHDGLVYLAEESGYIHCLDAKTGQRYWDHDFKESLWGSPYYVDGKVYIGLESGDVFIFKHGKERIYYADGMEQLDAKDNFRNARMAASMEGPMHGTPVVANGVLYFTTTTKLYAIR